MGEDDAVFFRPVSANEVDVTTRMGTETRSARWTRGSYDPVACTWGWNRDGDKNELMWPMLRWCEARRMLEQASTGNPCVMPLSARDVYEIKHRMWIAVRPTGVWA